MPQHANHVQQLDRAVRRQQRGCDADTEGIVDDQVPVGAVVPDEDA